MVADREVDEGSLPTIDHSIEVADLLKQGWLKGLMVGKGAPNLSKRLGSPQIGVVGHQLFD
ncbi:hypothetical protein CRG98_040142 [Punica granatum]|uniref:Uncharacterized protein n=1 Tax=Punica granatum TaxID=22663 RepID=A0A2I0I7T2_PUNGR|nr:hypothetical protein CRG98_040142 [Punica granatum]